MSLRSKMKELNLNIDTRLIDNQTQEVINYMSQYGLNSKDTFRAIEREVRIALFVN